MTVDLHVPRVVADLEKLDRHEWLAVRRSGIGSSDAPALLGWSPWVSPWALWLDKTGALDDADDEPTEAMEIGSLIEAFILDLFARRTGIRTRQPAKTYRHPDAAWMMASPDGICDVDEAPGYGIVEAKNVSAWKTDEWSPGEPDADGVPRGGEAPAHYLVQVQWQHAVMGTRHGWLAALLGGNRLCIVEVPRDDELIDMIVAAAEGFWHDQVMAMVPPPIDGQDTTVELLKKLFEESDPDGTVVLDEEAAAAVADYHDASARAAAAEERKKQAGNRLRVALREAEEAYAPDGQTRLVTWRSSLRTEFDEATFKAEQPELAEKYTRSKVVRQLRPSKSKAALEVLDRLVTTDHDQDDDQEEAADADH